MTVVRLDEDEWKLKLGCLLYSDSSGMNELDKAIANLRTRLKLESPSNKEENAYQIAYAMSGSRGEPSRQIVHPFSCEKFDLPDCKIEDGLEKCNSALEEADTMEKKFLVLWRLLPSIFELTPDGSAFKNPCFWDVRNMASAIASTGEDRAYLYFTVAGVHEFITPARRTQDLWAGSYLLSYLMWRAMQPIVEELGPDVVIQPNLLEQPLVDIWLKNKRIDIAFPKAESLKIANLPNFFFAIVPKQKAKELGKKAKSAFNEAWKEISFAIKNYLEKEKNITGDDEWNNVWKRQQDGVFEIYWGACNWGTDVGGVLLEYKSAGIEFPFSEKKFRERLNKIKGAGKWGFIYPLLSTMTGTSVTQRKNLRDFSYLEEPGEKCILCGHREALHIHYKNPQNMRRELISFWDSARDALGIQLRKGEMLCSVCITKRLAGEAFFAKALFKEFNATFPSTGNIASATFKLRVLEKLNHDSRLSNATHAYLRYLNELFVDLPPVPPIPRLLRFSDGDGKEFVEIDGELLYQEAFSWERVKKEHEKEVKMRKMTEEAQLKAQDALRKLMREAKRLEISIPSKYYAMLYMDGDHMSKWLNGSNLPRMKDAIPELDDIDYDERRPLSPTLHRSLSGALRNYSVQIVRKVVEEMHAGKLVYAGGDDVLALAPVEDLLDILFELRILFSGSMDGSDYTGKKVDEKEMRAKAGFVDTGNKWSMVMGKSATASIGVAISHYLYPFYRSVNEVNTALFVEAKQDRDSFAITLIEKSGSKLQMRLKWRYGDVYTIEVLEKIIELYKSGKLAKTLPYHLREGGIGVEDLGETQISEFKRIFERHLDKKDKGADKVENDVVNLFKEMKKEFDSKGMIKEECWNRMVNILLLARFFAGEENS